MIKIGIIQFPGSNCERETHLAIQRAQMQPITILWTSSLEQLDNLDGFVLIGGFSFEDRIRAGAIAAQSGLMKAIIRQAELGKPILGICNGAQILVESGLVPGIVNQNNQPLIKIALVDNLCQEGSHIKPSGYFNDWCFIKAQETHLFGEKDTLLRMPFAHAQGRFILDESIATSLVKNTNSSSLKPCIWQYCNQQGQVINQYPINPNGSEHNIAAISNFSGNVLAIMPHPERTPLADSIFKKMHDNLSHKLTKYKTVTLKTQPPVLKKIRINLKEELVTKLNIQDNEAISAQQSFKQLGYPVTLKKWAYWKIDAPIATKESILRTQELYNTNKESMCHTLPQNTDFYLVIDKTDIKGSYLKYLLKNHYKISHLEQLQYGVLWGITRNPLFKKETILNTNLLHNPISQSIYQVEP